MTLTTLYQFDFSRINTCNMAHFISSQIIFELRINNGKEQLRDLNLEKPYISDYERTSSQIDAYRMTTPAYTTYAVFYSSFA